MDPSTGLGLTHPRGRTSTQQESTVTTNSSTAAASAAPPTGSALHSRGHPGLVLTLILTCQLMVVLDATIVNIALPDIRTALHFSSTSLSWVINAYTLTFGGLLLLGARAGDILGRRLTFLAGITLFTAASLVGGFAASSGELLAARAAQGIGAALASPSALALLMTMFPQGRERTRAVGLYTAVSIGGSAVGLIAGGMLTQWVSWRWVLFVNVPIGVAVIALSRLVLPETPRSPGRFDLTGALTSTIGMTGLVYGFVHAGSNGWANTATITSFAVGVVLLVAFVLTELRARHNQRPRILLQQAKTRRADGPPGRTHYRLFCVLDVHAKGHRPLLVILDGDQKPLRTEMPAKVYARVRRHRDEYLSRNPRSLA